MKGRWNDQIQCAAFSVSSIDSVHSLKGSVMRWGWHLKVVTERLAATRGGWSRASAARTWQARARLCRLTRLLGWARQSSSAVTSRVYGKFSIRAGRPVLMHHMVSITPCAQISAWLTRCWVIQLKQGSPRFASDSRLFTQTRRGWREVYAWAPEHMISNDRTHKHTHTAVMVTEV